MMSHDLYRTLKPGENWPKATLMKMYPVYCSVTMATVEKMINVRKLENKMSHSLYVLCVTAGCPDYKLYSLIYSP